MATTPTTAVEDVRRDVRLVGVLLLALIVVGYQPLPFKLAGIAFGVLTVLVSIRALGRLGRLRRTGGHPRGQVALSAGLGLASIVTVTLLYQAFTYPIAAEREKCLAGAVTRTASDLCEQQYQKRLEDLIAPWVERE